MTGSGRIAGELERLTRIAVEGTCAPHDLPALLDRIVAAAGDLPSPSWPGNLVARPISGTPATWHARQLGACGAAAGDWSKLGAADRARLTYHLRWLCHHFGTLDPDCRPRVSVLIPVYNCAGMIGQAIESCLAQTAGPVEIVVVDDGSTDDLMAVLSPFVESLGQCFVLRHQPNGGLSRARRTAIEAATGDLVQFLDADDILLPEAIAERFAGFAAVPDAELCYGGIIGYDPDNIRLNFATYENPDGGPLCPTTDLARSTAQRLPFLPSTVMIPRWVLLEIDAFREPLRRGEDIRLWFRLGARRPKVLGLIGETVLRRYRADSLGQLYDEPSCSHAIAALTNLCDLIADPDRWPSAFPYVLGMAQVHVWEEANRGAAPALASTRARVLEAVAAFGRGRADDGLSRQPLLLMLLAGVRSLAEELGVTDQPSFAFHRAVEQALLSALATASPPGDEDVAFWLAPERCAFLDSRAGRAVAAVVADPRVRQASPGVDPAAQILLHLANPTFDPTRFGPATLARLGANRIAARAPAPASGRPYPTSRLLAWLPSVRRQRDRQTALDWLDRLSAGGPMGSWLAAVDHPAAWASLEQWAAVGDVPVGHADGLRVATAAASDVHSHERLASRTRAAFHARALARCLAPAAQRSPSGVTVAIAATTWDDRLVETVQAALGQQDARVEVILVGDTGIDCPPGGPPVRDARLKVVGRVRPDAIAAFNTAVSYAVSDFLMFLEPGSVLRPDCLATHLKVFADRPDAMMSWNAVRHQRAPAEGLMAAVARGSGPGAGEYVLPLWMMQATGPLDRWLAGGVFERYAFRLARRDPVVVSIDEPLASLPDQPSLSPSAGPALDMLDLADLLARPKFWRHCFQVARRMRFAVGVPAVPDAAGLVHGLAADRLAETVKSLADGRTVEGLSPAVGLAILLAGLAHREGEGARALERQVTRAAASVSPPADADARFIAAAGLDRDLVSSVRDLGTGARELPESLLQAVALITAP